MRNRKKEQAAPGPRRYATRQTTEPARLEELRLAREDADRRAEEIRRERELALQNQVVAVPGNRRDGSLYIAFIQMGQGDCAILSTPRGQVVMIDCGSDATETTNEKDYYDGIRGLIYSEKFLKNSKDLDHLVLTHPDTDHYNRLRRVLDDDIKIYNVYHSARIENYVFTSAWIKSHMAVEPVEKSIKGVTINEQGKKLVNDENIQEGDKDPRGALRVLAEPDCSISILAGNVTPSRSKLKDNSNDTNRGSLVVLIEAFGHKIMVCGDATKITEEFLLRTYKDLKDLHLLAIPHHGSARTSSEVDFVTQMNPRICVISAGKKVLKDHLPGSETIEKYLAGERLGTVSLHEISYWEPAAMGSYVHSYRSIVKGLYVTGSNLSQVYKLDPPDKEMSD